MSYLDFRDSADTRVCFKSTSYFREKTDDLFSSSIATQETGNQATLREDKYPPLAPAIVFARARHVEAVRGRFCWNTPAEVFRNDLILRHLELSRYPASQRSAMDSGIRFVIFAVRHSKGRRLEFKERALHLHDTQRLTRAAGPDLPGHVRPMEGSGIAGHPWFACSMNCNDTQRQPLETNLFEPMALQLQSKLLCCREVSNPVQQVLVSRCVATSR